jgi:nitric oxide reductase NorQ protein
VPVVDAHDDFMLVISYNPGYQTVLKDLKPSTKQRFVGIQSGYPAEAIEREIVARESGGLDADRVERLVAAGRRARALKGCCAGRVAARTCSRPAVRAARPISAWRARRASRCCWMPCPVTGRACRR